MMNPFILKKWAALLLNSFLSCIFFLVGLNQYGLFYGVLFLGAGALIGAVVGSMLLKNPWTGMLEGKGILVLDVNSTGVIRPFIVEVRNPFVQGTGKNKKVNDVFDRDCVFYLAAAKKAGVAIKGDSGLQLEINEEDYNSGRFALYQYPMMMYNSNIGAFITKEMITEQENNTFANHTVLYLNRKVEELSGLMRDFGRHVVEQTRPENSFLANNWKMIAVVIVVIVLALLFGKPLLATISNLGGGTAAGVIKTAAGAVSIN